MLVVYSTVSTVIGTISLRRDRGTICYSRSMYHLYLMNSHHLYTAVILLVILNFLTFTYVNPMAANVYVYYVL